VRVSRQLTSVLVGLLIGTALGPQIRREFKRVDLPSQNGNSDRTGSGTESDTHLASPKILYMKTVYLTCHVMLSGAADEKEASVNRDLNLKQCSVRLESPTYSWN